MHRLIATAALAAIVTLAGCSVSSPTKPADEPASNTRADVQWGDYGPDLQSQIDGLETAKDCDGLQSQFSTADANSTVTLARTGHSNAELMSYIDEALKLAGCY